MHCCGRLLKMLYLLRDTHYYNQDDRVVFTTIILLPAIYYSYSKKIARVTTCQSCKTVVTQL